MRSKVRFLLPLVYCLLLTISGCGQSTGELQAPSGNELERYLADHPELKDVKDPDDISRR